MAKISRDELLKIAHLSRLRLDEGEISALQSQIEDVLTYAARVNEIAQEADIASSTKINVFREDLVAGCKPEPILAQAPEREDNYFVVPRIIEQ